MRGNVLMFPQLDVREEASRRLKAEMTIVKHGYVPLGFVPGITVEMLEEFAKQLEENDVQK